MESIQKLEETIATWYAGMPHLPKNGQKWLATNAWWIVLVGVLLSCVGIFVFLMITFAVGTFIASTAGAAGVALGGIALLTAFAYLILSVGEVVLSALAVAPLKALQKKGWSLLFMATLINVLSLVLSFIFSFQLFSLLRGFVALAIGLYFLFEIRDYYTLVSHSTKQTDKSK